MRKNKESRIRTSTPSLRVTKPIAKQASQVTDQINKKVKRSLFRSKRRVVRYGLLASNIVLVSVIAGFIITNRSSTSLSSPALSLSKETTTNALDTISSADIAVNVAQLVRMEQTTAVINNADTLNSQLDIVPNDAQAVAKPQIIETNLKSKKDIQTYVAVEGDTLASVAEKFGVTSDSIRWSNELNGTTVEAGKELVIPPVNGLVYTVKGGDTPSSLANKYQADEKQLIAFNDAEISGLIEGERIVIPDGKVPAPVRRATPSYAGFRFGSSAVYGYNGYDYGYCTWYAANKRAAIGRPVPANLGNASTWKVLAQRAGMATGSTPAAGAVIWTPPRDYYGHVGFVEDVYADGSVLVSEMNVRGWNVVTSKVLTPEQAAGYSYIY